MNSRDLASTLIVALQETRFAEAASLREKDFTFYYWHGKSKDKRT